MGKSEVRPHEQEELDMSLDGLEEEDSLKFHQLADIPSDAFPLFMSIAEVLRLIDGCLKEPFFKRGEKGWIQEQIKPEFNEEDKHFEIKNLKSQGYRKARLVDF